MWMVKAAYVKAFGCCYTVRTVTASESIPSRYVLYPVAPYDFDLTAGYATYFRGQYGTESFEDGEYRRALHIGDRVGLVTVRSTGTVDEPQLALDISGLDGDAAAMDEARRKAAWILAVDDDIRPFYALAADDELLAPFVREFRGLRPARTPSVFEALVLAILGQQISSSVARMLRAGIIEAYGAPVDAEGIQYHAFPRPESLAGVDVAALRKLKLSERKAQYIIGIAQRTLSGGLDVESLQRLSDEDATRTLIDLPGVGPWTAHWIFIRALGRTDGFPSGDLALQKFLGALANGGEPMAARQADEYSKRWSPYRSYVTTYLFAAARSGARSLLEPNAGADEESR